jgi:hypothetical protein
MLIIIIIIIIIILKLLLWEGQGGEVSEPSNEAVHFQISGSTGQESNCKLFVLPHLCCAIVLVISRQL